MTKKNERIKEMKNVSLPIAQGISDLLETLLKDDEDELNPYSESQIKFAINKYLVFCVTKNMLTDFTIVRIVSSPKYLLIHLEFKKDSKTFDFRLDTKF